MLIVGVQPPAPGAGRGYARKLQTNALCFRNAGQTGKTRWFLGRGEHFGRQGLQGPRRRVRHGRWTGLSVCPGWAWQTISAG
eukprot:13097877-Alexandrium_andersonii.AAC.1